MKELYKIPAFMAVYTTKDGQIYRFNRYGFLTKMAEKRVEIGYPSVSCISKSGKRISRPIHRCIMEALFPVDGMEHLVVNHKNLDKNDYRLENLEWVTRSRNTKHYFESLGFEYAEDGSTLKKWDRENAAGIDWGRRRDYYAAMKVK